MEVETKSCNNVEVIVEDKESPLPSVSEEKKDTKVNDPPNTSISVEECQFNKAPPGDDEEEEEDGDQNLKPDQKPSE